MVIDELARERVHIKAEIPLEELVANLDLDADRIVK